MLRPLIRRTCLVWLLAFSLIGCHLGGPRSIRTGRGNYNVAIAQTNNQQLLLNLVRLRYRDTPVFLAVSSISTSFTFGADIGANAGDSPEGGVVGVSGGIAYAERPTVTYAPLQGQQFANQIMSPMSLRVILLLHHSGWRIDRVLRVCLQSIGSLPNARGAASPTPPLVPEYEEFATLVTNLRALQSRGLLELGQAASDEQAIVLEALPAARGLPELEAIGEALGAEPGTVRFTLTTSGATTPGTISVVTRSVVGSMFFLSQGVEAPLRDQREGRVTVTLDEDGRPFDWSDITGDLMRIRSSERAPDNAFAGVAYRGSWFYIDDSDLEDEIHVRASGDGPPGRSCPGGSRDGIEPAVP